MIFFVHKTRVKTNYEILFFLTAAGGLFLVLLWALVFARGFLNGEAQAGARAAIQRGAGNALTGLAERTLDYASRFVASADGPLPFGSGSNARALVASERAVDDLIVWRDGAAQSLLATGDPIDPELIAAAALNPPADDIALHGRIEDSGYALSRGSARFISYGGAAYAIAFARF